MKEEIKQSIRRMRISGEGYKAIAASLGISVNTVKSFCQRNGLAPASMESVTGFCEQCGKPLTRTPGKKPKRFCCDECRYQYWKEHPEEAHHRNERIMTCPCCGRKFPVFRQAERKYCSHGCYIHMRFGGAA